MELEIREWCLYPPGYLTQGSQQEGSIHLHKIREEHDSPRHRVSKLKVHPTYKKDREDGILVEFSFSLQRHADLPHDLALASNSHYYHKPIPCNSKVSINTLSTTDKQESPRKSSHRSKLPEGTISYNNFSNRRKRYDIPTPRNHIIQGFTSKYNLNPWYGL